MRVCEVSEGAILIKTTTPNHTPHPNTPHTALRRTKTRLPETRGGSPCPGPRRILRRTYRNGQRPHRRAGERASRSNPGAGGPDSTAPQGTVGGQQGQGGAKDAEGGRARGPGVEERG